MCCGSFPLEYLENDDHFIKREFISTLYYTTAACTTLRPPDTTPSPPIRPTSPTRRRRLGNFSTDSRGNDDTNI